MSTRTRPIRSTIIWALIGGLAYLPLNSTLNVLTRPIGFHLSLWVLLVGYAVMLSRWVSRPLKSICLPLLLLLVSAFLINSVTAFLFIALVILGWIRSGICFKGKPPLKRLLAELGLGLIAGLLVSGAVPGATLLAALGVWLFLLIQALYFVLFEYQTRCRSSIDVDPFERAKISAEKILSGGAF